jgi:hypothetical protein
MHWFAVILSSFVPSAAEPAITACTINGFPAGEHARGIDDSLRIAWQLWNPVKGSRRSLLLLHTLICQSALFQAHRNSRSKYQLSAIRSTGRLATWHRRIRLI